MLKHRNATISEGDFITYIKIHISFLPFIHHIIMYIPKQKRRRGRRQKKGFRDDDIGHPNSQADSSDHSCNVGVLTPIFFMSRIFADPNKLRKR